jgi:hypothetical protein
MENVNKVFVISAVPVKVPFDAKVEEVGREDIFEYTTFESEDATRVFVYDSDQNTFPRSDAVLHTGNGEYVIPKGTFTEIESGLTTLTA